MADAASNLTTAVMGTRNFDPETVPAYPLVRVQLRHGSEEGVVEGVVDDVVVHAGPESEPVREAVIASAAQVAAKRIGAVKAVRVRGIGLDGVAFRLVVTADAQVFEISEPIAMPGKNIRKKSTNSNNRKDRTNSSKTNKRQTRGGPSLLFLVIIGLPILLLVGSPVTALIWRHVHSDRAEKVQPLPPPVQLPVVPPAPYSDVAAWSQPLGTVGYGTADSAQVVADAHQVYVTRDTGSKLAAYGVKGRLRWTYTDLGGQVSVGPALATVGGRRVLEVATQTQLTLLDLAGRLVGQWKIPSSAQGVRLTPTGPVVLTDPVHAEVVSGDRLVSRVIPATGTPVAPTSDGSLLVVAGKGAQALVWTVVSSQLAGDPASVAAPIGTAFAGVAGVAADRLVLAFQSTDQSGASKAVLAAYRPEPPPPASSGSSSALPRSWRQQWVSAPVANEYTGGTDAASTGNFPLKASSTGAWGIYGSSVLDLATGKITGQLPPDWKTSVVGGTQAFGTGAGRPLVVTPNGLTGQSLKAPRPPTEATLVAPQAAFGRAAYVVATPTGSDAILYALQMPTTGRRK